MRIVITFVDWNGNVCVIHEDFKNYVKHPVLHEWIKAFMNDERTFMDEAGSSMGFGDEYKNVVELISIIITH